MKQMCFESDIDLIFIYNDEKKPFRKDNDDSQTFFFKLVRKIISGLSTLTSRGILYRMDTRLRPSGNQGVLVLSLNAFKEYHERDLLTWERIAYLKCRPVAGDSVLSEVVDDIIQKSLKKTFSIKKKNERRR